MSYSYIFVNIMTDYERDYLDLRVKVAVKSVNFVSTLPTKGSNFKVVFPRMSEPKTKVPHFPSC
jgi:hypothetical protein